MGEVRSCDVDLPGEERYIRGHLSAPAARNEERNVS